jgi:hypothetical protein
VCTSCQVKKPVIPALSWDPSPGRSHDIPIKISSIRVVLLDQVDFPRLPPSFDLLLPCDRGKGVLTDLKIKQ